MILPGSAPMYVRRWPRISASSRTPPSDWRTNLRPSARAIDCPRLVLPVPGGPRKHRITPSLSPIRFDARFFGALLPPQFEASYTPIEATAQLWLTAKNALAEGAANRLPMIPPNLSSLRSAVDAPDFAHWRHCVAGLTIRPRT